MSSDTPIRFGEWTLHPREGELERGGERQRLQDLPLRILLELLDQPGRLVTREQLIAKLWPKGLVEFEGGLNTAISKLRATLGDDADAPRYIAGYCLGNDVSERSFQLERGGQWTKGKSADTFAPLGPYLVTGGIDPGNLAIWLAVNGEQRQRSNTNQMIFGPAKLVSYISEFMS